MECQGLPGCLHQVPCARQAHNTHALKAPWQQCLLVLVLAVAARGQPFCLIPPGAGAQTAQGRRAAARAHLFCKGLFMW